MRSSTKNRKQKRSKQILEVKNIIIEMENSIESFNSRLNQAEKKYQWAQTQIIWKHPGEEQKEKKMKRKEENLLDLWDTI